MGEHFIMFFDVETCVNTSIIGWTAIQCFTYRIQQEESAVRWFYNDVVQFIKVDCCGDGGGHGSLLVMVTVFQM